MQTGSSVFMMTAKNVLMPGVFQGEVMGQTGAMLMEIASPGGKVYTTAAHNVFDEETGRIMLAHARAEQMAAQGYEIACRNDGSFRVYQAAKHGATGGYVVREARPGCYTCHCPATEKNSCCKHVQAVCSLLHNKAHRASARGWKSGAVRYENLAVRVASDGFAAERRERVLANIARDF